MIFDILFDALFNKIEQLESRMEFMPLEQRNKVIPHMHESKRMFERHQDKVKDKVRYDEAMTRLNKLCEDYPE